jgi:hypothetical protein
VADVPNGLSLTPPQETKKKKPNKQEVWCSGKVLNLSTVRISTGLPAVLSVPSSVPANSEILGLPSERDKDSNLRNPYLFTLSFGSMDPVQIQYRT